MTGEKKASAVRYHRRTLLAAADRLLVEHGYDGMNMNMLAKEAGYSKATVYVYFESKDEIVRELSLQRLELLESELKLVLKNDMATSEKLKEVAKVIIEMAREDGVYFDFITKDVTATLPDGCTRAQELLAETVGRIFDELCSLAPADELKEKWFALYGKIKTSKMFK